MASNFSVDEIDDIFGDVGGVVGDSFDVSGSREKLHGGCEFVDVIVNVLVEVVDYLTI